MESGPVESLGHGVDLAVVDLRVEVAEGLGGRLDALVRDAGRGEEAAGRLVVAGGVGLGEGGDLGNELLHLRLDVGHVVVDGGVGQLLLRLGDGGRVPGDGELGEADRGADQLELAGRVVGARVELGDVGDGLARGHVLFLSHDAQLVVGEDLELVRVGAAVGDLEADCPRGGGRGRDLTAVIGDGDGESGALGGVVGNASGQRDGECGDARDAKEGT